MHFLPTWCCHDLKDLEAKSLRCVHHPVRLHSQTGYHHCTIDNTPASSSSSSLSTFGSVPAGVRSFFNYLLPFYSVFLREAQHFQASSAPVYYVITIISVCLFHYSIQNTRKQITHSLLIYMYHGHTESEAKPAVSETGL